MATFDAERFVGTADAIGAGLVGALMADRAARASDRAEAARIRAVTARLRAARLARQAAVERQAAGDAARVEEYRAAIRLKAIRYLAEQR